MNQPKPPWLVAKVDQFRARMVEAIGIDGIKLLGQSADAVMSPLNEPNHEMTPEEVEEWNRTCDRCGTWVPDDGVFYSGVTNEVFYGTEVALFFGVCGPCKESS